MPETPGDLYLAHQAAIESVIQFVCRRRGLRGADAEDFKQVVRLRLLESDRAILRKYEGRARAKIPTYLTVVIERIGLDYQASRWGRWRPSALARAEGAAATRLEQLVCRDGRPIDDAIETVERELPGTDRAKLESLAARFTRRWRRQFLSDDLLEWIPDMAPGIDDVLVRADEEKRLERITARLRDMVSSLDPADQLLLQYKFARGMKVADIARLQETDQKRLYRRLDSVLSQMRTILESEGLDVSVVRSVLRAIEPDTPGPEAGQTVRLYERNTP